MPPGAKLMGEELGLAREIVLGCRVDVEVIVREVREDADTKRPDLRRSRGGEPSARHFERAGAGATRVCFGERGHEAVEVERMVEPFVVDEVAEGRRARDVGMPGARASLRSRWSRTISHSCR